MYSFTSMTFDDKINNHRITFEEEIFFFERTALRYIEEIKNFEDEMENNDIEITEELEDMLEEVYQYYENATNHSDIFHSEVLRLFFKIEEETESTFSKEYAEKTEKEFQEFIDERIREMRNYEIDLRGYKEEIISIYDNKENM